MSINVILWSKCKYRTAHCRGEVTCLVRKALDKPCALEATVLVPYVAHA